MIASYLHNRHKRPTLKTSYNSLQESLWKVKKQSKIQAESNLILKTTFLKLQKGENRFVNKKNPNRRPLSLKQNQNNELQQLQNRCLENSLGSRIVEDKIVEKQKKRYSELIVSIKNQQNWIKSTKAQIEEKNFDKMKQRTKILQNLVTQYTKKLVKIQNVNNRREKKYQKVSNKTNNCVGQQMQELKKILGQLQYKGEKKAMQIDELDIQMKKINQEILQLLNVKNQLKKLAQ